ncbi:MAG: LapA family protein [Rhodobacteraceae bacterium]|nr:LapA family protein [Paracoccaceae bacterium]
MRFLRVILLVMLGGCLVLLSVANREPVTLRLFPNGMTGYIPMPPPVEVPLFLVMFVCMIAGVLIGFVWEWLREHKHRARAVRRKSRIRKLESQVTDLRKDQDSDRDEILELLE